MKIKDSVTAFAYNSISLYHDIKWYIIIILTLVYWSLYKILKEYSYSWNTFLKSILKLRVQRLNFFIYNMFNRIQGLNEKNIKW
jgi:hypothetical protein